MLQQSLTLEFLGVCAWHNSFRAKALVKFLLLKDLSDKSLFGREDCYQRFIRDFAQNPKTVKSRRNKELHVQSLPPTVSPNAACLPLSVSVLSVPSGVASTLVFEISRCNWLRALAPHGL